MTNKIGYNQLPDASEFEKLYLTKSQKELAVYYSCNKKRINKWIKQFKLKLRPKGGGNNRKYQFDPNDIQSLIDDGYSINEICEQLNIKRSSLYDWMKKFDIKRSEKTSDYEKYKRRARWLTEKTYVENKNTLNPNEYPRTLCGVPGGYQLDHIEGLHECFIKGKSVEQASSITNLQFIPWEENLQKRDYNNYNRGYVKNE